MSEYYLFPIKGYKPAKLEISTNNIIIEIDNKRSGFEKQKLIKQLEELVKYLHKYKNI